MQHQPTRTPKGKSLSQKRERVDKPRPKFLEVTMRRETKGEEKTLGDVRTPTSGSNDYITLIMMLLMIITLERGTPTRSTSAVEGLPSNPSNRSLAF